MTLLRLDGFEGYGGALGLAQGYSGASAGLSVGNGRGGGAALFLQGTTFTFITPDGATNIIQGFARKSLLGGNAIVQIKSAVQATGYADLGIDEVGRIFSHKIDQTDWFRVDPGMRLGGVWRYYELDFKLHASAGHIILRIDEQEIVNLTGLNTAQSAGSEIKKLIYNGSGEYFDDYYVCDDQDTSDGCTGFLGDRRMFNIYPNGAVTAAWTPKTVGANYLQVKETANDDDGSYVSTTVVDTEDKHDYENTGLPGAQEVLVALMTSARRDADSGPRQLTSFFDCGGHRLEGALHQLSETYYMEQLRMTKHPFTAANLTAADIDAARAGYRLTA
jgi:hypothetical protein